MPEEQLLAVAQFDEKFGELVKLPTLYKENLASVVKAEAFTDQLMKPFNSLDMATVEVEIMESALAPLRLLRAKLDTTEKAINVGRKPHTTYLNSLISLFTGLEARVKAKFTLIKNGEDAWQTELLRRDKAKVAADAKIVKEAQDKVNAIAAVTKQLNGRFIAALALTISNMTKKFYAQTADTLPAFVNSIKQWEPSFNMQAIVVDISGQADHIAQAILDSKDIFASEFIARCKKERDNLVDLKVGRIEQLKVSPEFTPEARVDLSGLSEQMNEAVEAGAAKDRLDASFQVTPGVLVVSAGGKGKTVKKKYVVETPEAMQAIMQSWATFSMPLLSMEELNKTLSFMRTAASARLNEGHPPLEAKGLTVVDDISTRTTKIPK